MGGDSPIAATIPFGAFGGHADFTMHEGKPTEAVDVFAHPFRDCIRDRVSDKALRMRGQGFCGTAMPPMGEFEYV